MKTWLNQKSESPPCDNCLIAGKDKMMYKGEKTKEELIEGGADVNLKDFMGRMALTFAEWRKSDKLIKILKEAAKKAKKKAPSIKERLEQSNSKYPAQFKKVIKFIFIVVFLGK